MSEGRKLYLTQEQVKEAIAPYINNFQFRDCFEIVTDRLNDALAEASERSEKGTRKELVRDKIEAVARLWYASEPDKGLRERLTEGLIDKMTAAVLPALTEASQRSETGTRELFEAIQTVCAWEQDYRTRNNLGPKPPDCFIRLAILAAKGQAGSETPAPHPDLARALERLEAKWRKEGALPSQARWLDSKAVAADELAAELRLLKRAGEMQSADHRPESK